VSLLVASRSIPALTMGLEGTRPQDRLPPSGARWDRHPRRIGDGVVLPTSGTTLPSNYNKVPIILGTTLEEGKLFVTSAYNLSDAQRWSR
jgi:hypothetical protein